MKNIDDDINWKERYVNLVNFISHKNEETQFYYEGLKNSGLERHINFSRGKLRAYDEIIDQQPKVFLDNIL